MAQTVVRVRSGAILAQGPSGKDIVGDRTLDAVVPTGSQISFSVIELIMREPAQQFTGPTIRFHAERGAPATLRVDRALRKACSRKFLSWRRAPRRPGFLCTRAAISHFAPARPGIPCSADSA